MTPFEQQTHVVGAYNLQTIVDDSQVPLFGENTSRQSLIASTQGWDNASLGVLIIEIEDKEDIQV